MRPSILLAAWIVACMQTSDAADLPRLPQGLAPSKQSFQAQRKLPDLDEAYVSTSPEDLGDGLQVGTFDLPGTEEAMTDSRTIKTSGLRGVDGEVLFPERVFEFRFAHK